MTIRFLTFPLRRSLLSGLLLTALFLAGCRNPSHSPSGAPARSHSSVAENFAPPLLLISIDGFRWDYMDKTDTPNLDMLAAGGFGVDEIPAYRAAGASAFGLAAPLLFGTEGSPGKNIAHALTLARGDR